MPNVNTDTSAEVDIYQETGILPGTAVLIQNQGSVTISVRENMTDTGYLIPPFGERECTGSNVLLLKGITGLRVFIQVAL